VYEEKEIDVIEEEDKNDPILSGDKGPSDLHKDNLESIGEGLRGEESKKGTKRR